jgi:hypothetical protein
MDSGHRQPEVELDHFNLESPLPEELVPADTDRSKSGSGMLRRYREKCIAEPEARANKALPKLLPNSLVFGCMADEANEKFARKSSVYKEWTVRAGTHTSEFQDRCRLSAFDHRWRLRKSLAGRSSQGHRVVWAMMSAMTR